MINALMSVDDSLTSIVIDSVMLTALNLMLFAMISSVCYVYPLNPSPKSPQAPFDRSKIDSHGLAG
jgi:hypothetical protein